MALSILRRGAAILDRSISNLTGEEGQSAQNLYELLMKCPDDYPAPDATDPEFMDDADLRFDIRRDITEINRALQNTEWKASTVLAGSVIEALLLWALQNRANEEQVRKTPSAKPKPLEEWYIGDYSAVACELGIIKESTKSAVAQAHHFRNLIHPGRAQRLATKCSRSTAQLSVGALEAVIEDLKATGGER